MGMYSCPCFVDTQTHGHGYMPMPPDTLRTSLFVCVQPIRGANEDLPFRRDDARSRRGGLAAEGLAIDDLPIRGGDHRGVTRLVHAVDLAIGAGRRGAVDALAAEIGGPVLVAGL